MKVMTIGGATQDIFLQYENKELLRLFTKRGEQSFLILLEGGKIEVETVAYYTGGGATNAASSFCRLGFDVSTMFKTGADQQAAFIRKKLAQEKIDTSHCTKSKETQTGTSIIIPSMTGEATILAFRGANKELIQSDITEEKIKNFDQLYITSLSGKSSKLLPHITKLAKKHNIPVTVNPGVSQLAAGAYEIRESLANIDIFILNAYEANNFMETLVKTDTRLKEKVAQTAEKKETVHAPKLIQSPITYHDICFSIHQFLKEVLKRGPKIVAVTNGAEGVYVAYENKICFHPSLKVDITSTLGAGDAFGSCFTAGIALGKSVEESVLRGIIQSASVISYLDAKTGQLSLQELEKRASQLTTKDIQTFPLG